MRRKVLRVAFAAAAAAVLALAALILTSLLIVGILNNELYGRISETEHVPTFKDANPGMPTIRVVLHHILPEENGVESSIIVVVADDDKLAAPIREGKCVLTAEIHDGTTLAPVALGRETVFGPTAFKSGWSAAAVESEVFTLPADSSVGTYPFDDIRLRPMLWLRCHEGGLEFFNLEVQKAFAGRELRVSGKEGIAEITLSRTAVEKAYILTTACIVFVLSMAVAVALLVASSGLTIIQELIAVASYILAAAGARELLGLSRLQGTSVLEIFVVGVPLLLLTVGAIMSIVRTLRRLRTDEALQSGDLPPRPSA
jgi:hypothetical protein